MTEATAGKPTLERRLSLSALAVSFVALILSQFHPLYTYLDKPKLIVSVSQNAQVYHGFGNLGFNVFVQLRNQGKVVGTIKRIELFVEKVGDANYRRRLPAQTYYVKPSTLGPGQSVVQIPMSLIPIAPDGSWENFVNFYAPIPKEHQGRIAELVQAVQAQIQEKIVQHPEARTPQQADPALFGELSSFVAGNLSGFSVGEYYVLALFWDDRSDKPITSQLFGLSVYEADIKSLASITEQYRTGIGIFIIPMSQQGFQATLRSLQDEQVVAKLRKDFESM